MANFNSKVHIKTGTQKSLNKFDLSCSTYTTQDFFKMKPIFFKELMPGEKFHMNSITSMTRLSPLVNPMFAHCRIVNRAFWVPFRIVMEGFNEFITSTPYQFDLNQNPQLITQTSVVSNGELASLFLNHVGDREYIDYCSAVSPSSRYDFAMRDGGGILQNYRFTILGKHVYDILIGLGYKINFQSDGEDEYPMSALPILAFAKIFCDWYCNSAYRNYADIEAYFKGKNVSLDSEDLFNIFQVTTQVMYDKDYFTSAWDNPVSPNNSNIESNILFKDQSLRDTPESNKSLVTNSVSQSNGTPIIARSDLGSRNVTSLSQYILDTLKHVSDYVKRHQFLGSRVLDRYLGEYGIELNSAVLNRSSSLWRKDITIQISDVMQTSTDYDSNDGVGNYAGKGIGFGNSQGFDFEADEFGIIIVTSYVAYKNSYVDGRDRSIYHTNKFDFFHGEFDNLGSQAIMACELVNGFDDNMPGNTEYPQKVFGFTPRYAEYAVKQDILSGDLFYNSRNANLKGWNLLRRFIPTLDNYQDMQDIKHDLAFTLGDPTRNMDIFVDTNNYFDHFITAFHFDVTSYMPKRSLFDSLDFHSDGKDIIANVNGLSLTD